LLSWRRSALLLASICACEVPSAPSFRVLAFITPPPPSGGGDVVSHEVQFFGSPSPAWNSPSAPRPTKLKAWVTIG
jgi:hypothetical protein